MAYKTHEEILREELERVKANGSVAAMPQQTEPTVIAPAPSAEVVAESERLHAQDAAMPRQTGQAVAGFGVPPKQSDYDWNTKFAEQYFGSVMTEEERARRERAAYISSGVANLGKAFGALGNMFYAAHGAPAQEAVKVADVDPKIAAFRQRADKVRDAYLNAHRLDKSDFNEAYSRYLSGINSRYNMYVKQEELAIKRDREDRLRLKDKYMQKRQEALARKDEAQAKYWEAKADGVDALTQSQVRANLARAGASNASANASNARAEQLRNGTTVVTEKPERDAFGVPTGRTVQEVKRTTPNGSGGNSSQGGGGGNSQRTDNRPVIDY